DVYVNDQPVGKTPYQNEFPIGKYTYRLQKELYLNEAGIVELKAGDQKQIIKIQLKPNFGTLQISSTPENGAKVSLDGIPTGRVTPCTIDMVPTGEHTVKVSNDMYETTSNKVTVNPAESKQIIINMNSAFSEVTLQSEPKADIYINGVFKANGLWQGRLTPAVYSFEAKLDKYKTAFEKQTVETGIPVNLTLRPKPRTGNLKVISTPFEAFIKLNGKEMGQTPKTINSLLIGDYNVELSLPGYAPYIGKQTVVEDQTVILNTSLENGRSVTISSTPSGSTIYIDGVVSGTTPYNGNLNFGDHKVAIEHNGKRIEKTISVSQSGETNFNLSMNLDNINITTSPTGADVYIDNVFSGKSPLAVELAYGSHNLKLVKDDKSITDRIDFNTKSNKTIFYELSECNSTKQIISTPTGANVLINNELVGITPYYFGMKQKQVSVVLKKEGYNTYNGTLNCSDNSFSGYLSQKKKFDASNLFSFGMPVEIGLDGQDEVFLGLGFGLNIRIAPWLFIQNTLNLDYSFSDVMYLTGNHTICAGFPFSSSDEDILFAEYGIGYDIINGPTYNIFGLGYGTHKTNMTLRYKELIGLELAFRIEI
ncbi:MAG: PEGA domain-containing protein, partial [Opitutaceae bacterium]